jgi:hypothetical protein
LSLFSTNVRFLGVSLLDDTTVFGKQFVERKVFLSLMPRSGP